VDAMDWQVSASFAFAMVGGYIIGPYAPGAQALQQLIHSLTASAPDVTVSAGGRGRPLRAPERPRGGAPVVSLVVPTCNEAGNVEPLVDRVTAALGATPFEICFMDDSDDATGDVLLDLAQANPRIRALVRHGPDRKGGLSTAVVAGLR